MQLSISILSSSGRKLLSKKNPVLDKSDLHYTRSSAQRLLPFFAYLPIRVAPAIM